MELYLYKDLYTLEEKHWWHIAKRKLISDFLKKFAPQKKLKLLDVGCGTGKNVETFQAFGESGGIDMEKEAIVYCKKRGLKDIRLGRAEKTGYSAKSVDVVTMLDVLEHTDDEKVLPEIRRILKPGGLLMLTVPAYQWLWSQWDVVLHHERRYDPQGLAAILTKHGFEVVALSSVYSFLVLPAIIVRFIKSRLYKGKEYPSDFRLSSPMVNWLMLRVSRLEAQAVTRWGIPYGTSLVCVARKKNV